MSTAEKHTLKYDRRQAVPDNEAAAIYTQPRLGIYLVLSPKRIALASPEKR